MAWISPTGHNDPDTKWADEAKAYDEFTGTRATSDAAARSWSSFLELTHIAINCTKIRFYASYHDPGRDLIDIDVFYEDAWHHVYEGAFLNLEWVEKALPAGEKSVTAARVRLHCGEDWSYEQYLYEFDFWEVEVVTHELTVSDSIALTDTLVKNPIKVLADGVALSDVLIKNPIKVLVDNFTIGEALERWWSQHYEKVLVDGIALADVWEGYKLIAKVLTDGIAFTDTLVKSTSKVVADGMAFTDTLVKSASKLVTDGIAIGEALMKLTDKTLTDAVVLKDVLIKSTAKVLTDGITFTDVLIKLWVQRVLRVLKAVRNLLSVREDDRKR